MGWPTTSGDSSAASAISGRAARPPPRLIPPRPGSARRTCNARPDPDWRRPAPLPPTCPSSCAALIRRATTAGTAFISARRPARPSASADFGNADNSLVSYMLSNTELQSIVSNLDDIAERFDRKPKLWRFFRLQLPDGRRRSGRRTELQPHVDQNWRAGSDRTDPGSGRQPPDGSTVLYSVIVTSAASVAIHDIVTARARAGWTYDRFMPYGFVGLAVGRADASRFATLAGSYQNDDAACDAPGPRHGPIDFAARSPNTRARRHDRLWLYRRARCRSGTFAKCVCSRRMGIYPIPQYRRLSRVVANSARVGVGLKF